MQQTFGLNPKPHRSFDTFWSEEDQEFVGICHQFHSLSHLAATENDALSGIMQLVAHLDMSRAQVNTVEGFYTAKINVRIDHIDVDPDIVVYRQTQFMEKLASGWTAVPTLFVEDPQVDEGITTQNGLRALIAGKDPEPTDYCILRVKGREHLRLNGWERDMDQFSTRQPPFTLFSQGRAVADDIVRVDIGQMIFDRFGDVLPVAMTGSYLYDDHFDDEHYDLLKAAEHLMARQDVFVAAQRGFVEPDFTERALSPSDAIHDIPIYNRTSKRRQCLYIRWQPSREDYQRMWHKACTFVRPSLCRWRAIFDLDLLGLRAAGAAKVNDDHGSAS